MTVSVSATVRPSIPSDDLPLLAAGDRLNQPTFHELYEKTPESFRAELIGGRVYVASPLKYRHGNSHFKLATWLGVYELSTPGVEGADNATNILGGDSEPQSDATLRIVGGQTHINEDGYLVGPPELATEVALSSVAYDLHDKKDDYERYGVTEYLVVLLREKRVVWFVRPVNDPKGAFIEMQPDSDGNLKSVVFPGLWLDPAALLRGDSKRVLDVLNVGLATPEHAAFVAKHR